MLSDNNRLLYVLTARRELSWSAFKDVYSALGGEADPDTTIAYRRRQTVRTLDALGHCDSDASQPASRIYAGPPALARLPGAGLPQAVLCGGRTPSTLSRLESAVARCGKQVSVAAEPQGSNGSHVPDRIAVQADDEGRLPEVAAVLSIPYASTPPAWSMLHLSPTLDVYLGGLTWERGQEPNWTRSEYDPECAHFRRPPSAGAPPDYRLCRYINPVTGTSLHILWHGSSFAQVDAGWSRYAVLRHYGVPGLYYDNRRQTLACPLHAPLPRLMARGLTLCTGYAPTTLRGAHVRCQHDPPELLTVYHGVLPTLAEMTAQKLGQRLAGTSMLLDLEKK